MIHCFSNNAMVPCSSNNSLLLQCFNGSMFFRWFSAPPVIQCFEGLQAFNASLMIRGSTNSWGGFRGDAFQERVKAKCHSLPFLLSLPSLFPGYVSFILSLPCMPLSHCLSPSLPDSCVPSLPYRCWHRSSPLVSSASCICLSPLPSCPFFTHAFSAFVSLSSSSSLCLLPWYILCFILPTVSPVCASHMY